MTSVPSLRNISAVVLLVGVKAGGEFTFSLQQGRERVTEIATGRVISGDREVPREIIMERAGRAASGFAALGVAPGDAIAVVLRNDFPFFEASYAAQRLGAYCVPVNWHGKTPEIAYVLHDCSAKLLLARASGTNGSPASHHCRKAPPGRSRA